MRLEKKLPQTKGRNIFLLLLFLILANDGFSQTIFARGNGDWDVPGRWSTIGVGGPSCGCTPAPGDDVLIDGYDIDIDAGTGDVTVNSVKITNARNSDVRLRIQGGATLTVTNDFEIESDDAGNDAELTVEDAGSGLDIGGDFLADQNAGDDLLIDIDDDCVVNISGDADFLQDGGDDMQLNLNTNSGNAAEWHVTGDMTFDHDGGDDIIVLVDDINSLLDVDGDLTVRLNTGDDDDFTFNLDNGDVTIAGDLNLTRSDDCAQIDLDMEECILTCDDININSGGDLFTDGAVRFFIDGSSEINCANFTSTFTGGDDLYIRINVSNGTSGELNASGNMTLTRTAGDDIEIMLDEDDSELNVGGNFTFTSSGPDSEEFEFYLDNNSTVDIGGNCTLNTIDGEDEGGNLYLIWLEGGTDDPTFHVGGNFTWTTTIDIVDTEIDLDGGTFDVDGSMTLTQNAGGNDFDVTIDEDAVVTVGGSFSMTNNGGDDMSFRMGEAGATTSTFTVTGAASFIQNNSGSGATWTQRIYNGAQLIIGGSLTETTNFASSPLHLLDIQDNSEVSVSGNVNLNAPASGELEIRLIDNAFFRIGGNFVRAAAPNAFGEFDCSTGTPTCEYMGTSAQVIAEDVGSGGDSFYYYNLEIDNSFGTIPQLTMEGLATVHGDLTMNDGVVESDATDILVVDDNGTTSNASDASYVDGYMRKVGNDAFTFPCGNGGFYAPLGITAPTGATEQFECRYLLSTPHDDGYDSTAIPSGIDHISKVEYWQVNRTAGSSNPTVTLSWDTPRSGGVTSPADLRFMRWDGSAWQTHGAAGVAGTATAGTLNNSTAVTVFNGDPFTLGTVTPINPLPIELLDFTAELEIDHVNLRWTTKSESDNDYFTVERSQEGDQWEPIVEVDAAGNSSVELDYETVDLNPLNGTSYYRLKQTDFDGTYSYSPVAVINREIQLTIYPNPTNGNVSVVGESTIDDIVVYNATGQVVAVDSQQYDGEWKLSTDNLADGTYFLHLITPGGAVVERLIVRH
jgi:hypothetical protein